ncbi:restriction endonuclease subunit S [Methylocystis sp. SB2]|uniref:restriction endonuclease subunit S n=1 Tax=Methylocystis sp. (strain SB2) TaxID=743836 RepID=UPI0003FE64C8|nr:restriction endonuclease subunit S [Methylocystis sp. SB2]ULO25108.1 restriction endonuclease subunit S [Methylocystis sp. SB2]
MTNDGKPALTPKLRFPEFRDAEGWEIGKVDALVDTITPPKKLPTSHYASRGAFPIIDQSQANICGWTDDHEALIQGDLPLIIFGDHTCILKLIDRPFAQGADGIKILKSRQKVGTTYLYQLLTFRPVVTQEYKRHYSILKEKLVSFPDLNTGEQQKIADCLTSVDELIAAQARKVDALKGHKKGLMQQLFPREGETKPRLRFPDFEDVGEWGKKKLYELADIQSGATPSKANPEFWNGSIPWVSAKDMKRLFLEDAEDHISATAIDDGARLVPPGTLLVLTRGMTLLKDIPICFLRREMSFNQDVKGLRPKDGVDGLFLAWMLTGNKDRLLAMVDIAGHGTGKLDTDALKALELCLPPPPEQQRIAECLASLDDLIAAQIQKLDALKTHKKGLMQQLFPSADEVEA